MEDTFIEERLAAATAIPPSQRSPEVAAFIECGQLQQELANQLHQGGCCTPRQQTLRDIKLLRSHIISPTVPLWYRPAVLDAALARLMSAAKLSGLSQLSTGDPGRSFMALVRSDFSIETLLLLANGTVGLESKPNVSGMLPVYNNIVERMQRPAEAGRLRQELEQLQAGLPRSLLSYDQLLARFIWMAVIEAGNLLSIGDTSNADMRVAISTAAELLPKLVPKHLGLCFCSIATAGWHSNITDQPAMQARDQVAALKGLLESAKQEGSDLVVAQCGYQLAACAPLYGLMGFHVKQLAQHRNTTPEALTGEPITPPSAFLDWLQQARAARARCEAVLPLQWTDELKHRQKQAMLLQHWLQRQQQEGDSWQQSGPEQAQAGQHAGVRNYDASNICSGCGEVYPHVQICSGCKQARYWSRQCQRAHWKQHKGFCKAQQEARRKAT